MTTTHRVVLRKGPAALGTSGHGHRRAYLVAGDRRIAYWQCAKGTAPLHQCPDEPRRPA